MPEIVTFEQEFTCLITEYPFGFEIESKGEPLIKDVWDPRLIDAGVKQGCLVAKIGDTPMDSRSGKEVTHFARR